MLVGDTDSARCAVEALIFERRYGEKMTTRSAATSSVEDEWEQANLYVEGALRRVGIVYATAAPGHWLYESPGTVVHLHHYPGPRILDVYAPLSPLPDGDREELFGELLAENGGSIAGAFYGICSFGDSGEHLCSCARLATEHLTGPDLVYALNSVVALADRFAAARTISGELTLSSRARPRARRAWRRSPSSTSRRSPPSSPLRSAITSWLWMVSKLDLPRQHEGVVAQLGGWRSTGRRRGARTESSTKRGWGVGLLDHGRARRAA